MFKFPVHFDMEKEQQYCGGHLTNYRCIGGAFYAHFRTRPQPVDHNRIKNNIYNCSDHLADRGVE